MGVLVEMLRAFGFFSGVIFLSVYACHWKAGYMPPTYAHMPHLTHLSLDYIKECIVPLVSVSVVNY